MFDAGKGSGAVVFAADVAVAVVLFCLFAVLWALGWAGD